MNLDTSAIVYGFASAASWGTGDFNGGLASKRNTVYGVVLISQIISGFLLLILAFAFVETFPIWQDIIFGALAGISGTLGLLALYSGLSQSTMGIVAPLSAVLTAIIPIVVSALEDGLPAPAQMAGFALALFSVWLLSGAGKGFRVDAQTLFLPLLAGVGFGLFFIFIDRLSGQAVFIPLVAARLVSVPMMALFIFATRQRVKPIDGHSWITITLAGIFDTGGNTFFALATRIGRLDVSTVLASLYPAATILLAWLILKEKLSAKQWLGVAGALGALALISS